MGICEGRIAIVTGGGRGLGRAYALKLAAKGARVIAWGYGIAVAEGWQHGPITEASVDPAELGPRIVDILKHARSNAGIDRDTWMDP